MKWGILVQDFTNIFPTRGGSYWLIGPVVSEEMIIVWKLENQTANRHQVIKFLKWTFQNWQQKQINKDYIRGFKVGRLPGTFTRLRSCIVPAEITESPKISSGQNHNLAQVRWSIGLWNIFHKKLMITSIAEFSHSNRTTASRPSWWDIPCFKNNFTLES